MEINKLSHVNFMDLMKFNFWFYDGCFINCQSGWFELIHAMCMKIKETNEHDFLKIVAIGEKDGGLHFDVVNSTKKIDSIIDAFKSKSHYTCEVCGHISERKLTKMVNGVTSTMCGDC